MSSHWQKGEGLTGSSEKVSAWQRANVAGMWQKAARMVMLPFWLQGNEEFNTDENLRKRRALRFAPQVSTRTGLLSTAA